MCQQSCCNSIKLIQFQIGDEEEYTPIVGTTTYLNCSLSQENFTVEKAGFGTLFEGIHWARHYSGGFTLLIGVFSNDEFYTIKTY